MSSLNKHLTVRQTFELLGREAPAELFPSLTDCPLCQQHQLRLYSDYAGGAWFHCTGCQRHGDMIELSAAAWKLKIPVTIRKLADLGVPLPATATGDSEIDAYLRDYVHHRDRIRTFWGTCQREFFQHTSDGLYELRRQVGAAGQSDVATWLAHGGQFLGASTKMKVLATFRPLSAARMAVLTPYSSARSGADYPPIFRGPGWGEVLVMPYYDLPGRICAFLFMGREGTPEDTVLYTRQQTTNSTQKGSKGSIEAGLAMLPALLQGPHSKLGTTRFIFMDPILALQMQLRNLRETVLPLPIAAAHQGTTARTLTPWSWLPTSDLVFWASQPSVQAIRFARLANSCVSTYCLSADAIQSAITDYTMLEVLRRIKAQAIPWADALRQMLRRATAQRAEEIVSDVGLQGDELHRFILNSPEHLQLKLQDTVTVRQLTNTRVVNNRQVVERGDAWYYNNNTVSEAVIRIEKVLTTPSTRSYYQGHIYFKGQAIPFLERTEGPDKNLLVWARNYLRDHGHGQMTFGASWGPHGMELALAFHTPTTTSGITSVGWSEANNCFAFPRFLITRTGEVERNPVCLFVGETAPAGQLSPPAPLTPQEVANLGDTNSETRVFWATLACLVQNIVAPAMNREPTPVFLTGAGARAIGIETARRLGCLTVRNTTDPAATQHAWPVLLRRGDSAAIQEQPQNALAPVSWTMAQVLSIRGTWTGLCYDPEIGSAQLTGYAAGRVLSAYLQDLCRRKLYLPGTGTPTATNILHDLAEWFAPQADDYAGAVTAAASVLQVPGAFPPWVHFLRLTRRLYAAGLLPQIQTAGYPLTTAPGIVADRPNNRVWVSQRLFGQGVRTLTGLTPDVVLITRSLQTAGVLLEEAALDGVQGWAVPEQWWTTEWHKEKDHEDE